MTVWEKLIGQDHAAEVLRTTARAARDYLRSSGVDSNGGQGLAPSPSVLANLAHAWLITGPPGSGRSTAARAFAAALQCSGDEPGCGQCKACESVLKGSHLDVKLVATETVQILIDQARELVSWAHQSPLNGRWRVVLIEDTDRMSENTSNVLLKAIEEPPERTIWLLCAPSPEDVIGTIRSRCRLLSLRIPPVQAVAELLVSEGANPEIAQQAARVSQSHIGLARALANSEEKRELRSSVFSSPARVRNVSDAVYAAQDLMDIAKQQTEITSAQRNAQELSELYRALGANPDDSRQPPHIQSQVRQLKENQKRRATRLQRDALDRVLVDLLSLYRDVFFLQVGADVELINADLEDLVSSLAAESAPEQTVARMLAIEEARRRLDMNVNPQLALEAMAIALRPQARGAY